MEWKKAKTILILLFFVIDICLLGINIYNDMGDNNVEYEKLQSVLKSNNVILDKDVVKRTPKTSFVYEYTRIDLSEELKKSLLGDYDKSSDGRFTSKNKNALIKMDNDNFFYENKSPSYEKFENVNEKNVSRKLKDTLKLMGISKYAKVENIEKEKDNIKVNYAFVFEDSELFSSSLTFIVSQKGISKIFGAVNIPNGKKGYKFELSNIETVLLNFSRNNDFKQPVKIVEIKSGCYLADYENAVTAQALPAYMIKTVNKTYIYDARDGVDSSQRQLK